MNLEQVYPFEGKMALPIGIDSFQEMVSKEEWPQFYYVDKTMLIYEIVNSRNKVNLIPRPRRFGKSLNLDMLQQFLSIDTDPTLFDGLKISQYQEFCARYQGKYPVLYFDFKGVEGADFEDACLNIERLLRDMAESTEHLASSPRLSPSNLREYNKVLNLDQIPRETKTEQKKYLELLQNAPKLLTQLMMKHFGKPVVVLIDEYDVPLNHAYYGKYYQDMIGVIRGMFHNLLKANDNLEFAVLTGCLRISKESIFTGMNNLRVWSGKRNFNGEYFGFTEDEVKAMLDYYGIPEMLDIMRDWYDGFRFGKRHVYCPWDVLNFVTQFMSDDSPGEPENYWINTSGNSILKQLLSQAGFDAENDFSRLVAGKSIWKPITAELTYGDLDKKQGKKQEEKQKKTTALWSMMAASGYLTVRSQKAGMSELVVPNREVRWLLSDSLRDWLCSKYVSTDDVETFCTAIGDGDATAAETSLRKLLNDMLTIRVEQRSKERREDLYQGILLGLLRSMWMARAEVQSGKGYVDLSFCDTDRKGIVIEVKDAAGTTLEHACEEAIGQIWEKNYVDELVRQGADPILCWGIACKGLNCKVKLEQPGSASKNGSAPAGSGDPAPAAPE